MLEALLQRLESREVVIQKADDFGLAKGHDLIDIVNNFDNDVLKQKVKAALKSAALLPPPPVASQLTRPQQGVG
jgi:hypothetical protein